MKKPPQGGFFVCLTTKLLCLGLLIRSIHQCLASSRARSLIATLLKDLIHIERHASCKSLTRWRRRDFSTFIEIRHTHRIAFLLRDDHAAHHDIRAKISWLVDRKV